MSRAQHRILSRRRFLICAGSAAAAGLVAACGGSSGDDEPEPGTPGPGGLTPAPTATPTSPSAPGATPTATTPPSLTLEEMAGQMLLLGFQGTELSPANPIYEDITQRHIGGVVLFSSDLPSGGKRNIASPEQVAALTAQLQEAAGSGLIVATDEEGGLVARLDETHGFPPTKSAAELGAMGDPAATEQAASAMAATLKAAGVNLNLAPVVDLNTNPNNPVIGALGRSFGSDPQAVTAQAEAFLEGHHQHGILTCLKHFPGHGSSAGDTHAGFVDVTNSWDPVELDPYRALIGEGAADTVMVAHVFNANLDQQYPASLSNAVITGMLRGHLGFGGVVVSDDMEMGAITQQWAFRDAIRLAILAGNDLLTYGNNLDAYRPDLGARVHSTIVDLVKAGDIPEERIRQSYERVQALRARLA
ncbi:MAG: glycoside hydrolase family 3 protein [Hyphomicrobiales bacterium]